MTEDPLTKQACVPCLKGEAPMAAAEAATLLKQLNAQWQLLDQHHLYREFIVKNFAEALAFSNHIGAVAETLNHHPNIAFTWGRVEVTIYTHTIDGLHQNDFILAAHIDHLK